MPAETNGADPNQTTSESIRRRIPNEYSFRWIPCYTSVISLVIGLGSGLALGMIYAFATLVDPNLTSAERTREIADGMLFGGSDLLQLATLLIVTFGTIAGFTSCIVHLVVFLFGRPKVPNAILLILGSSIAGTSVFVSVLFLLRA